MKSVRFSKTSQFALVKVIVNFVLLLLIYFIMNCFEVSDTFPKGRGDKNFVIFVTKSSLIGLFLYSIFIENSNFLANQTGFGRVRTCYCEDSFYQEHVWSWNKTEAVWRGKMIHGRRQQNKRNSGGQTELDHCGRNSTKIRTLKLFYNLRINGGCHN